MQTGLLLGHIPVVAKAYRPLDQWSEWHPCRVEEAALAINRRYPEALACLPKTGFCVLAIVGQLPQLGQTPYIACGVHVCEDTSDIVWKGKGGNSSMGASVERASPDVLGTDWNPFPSLFEQLTQKMPEAWVRFLQCRRRYRSNPVPPWLVDLRREEQREKRKASTDTCARGCGSTSGWVMKGGPSNRRLGRDAGRRRTWQPRSGWALARVARTE